MKKVRFFLGVSSLIVISNWKKNIKVFCFGMVGKQMIRLLLVNVIR